MELSPELHALIEGLRREIAELRQENVVLKQEVLVPQSIDQPFQGRPYVVVGRDDAADTLNPPTNLSMVTEDVWHIGTARFRCAGVHPAAREEEIGHYLRHPIFAAPDASAAGRLDVRRDLRSHLRDEVCRIAIAVSGNSKGHIAVAIEQIDRMIDVDIEVPGVAYAPTDCHAQVRSGALEAGRKDRRRQVTPHCRPRAVVLPRDK